MVAQEREQHVALPIFSPQRVTIVCVGAGVSGIALAIKLQQTLGEYNLDIYEKNSSIGGTWFENRYPGCACGCYVASISCGLTVLILARRCACPCIRVYV
jgi:heterodisulfide reductase subunit A-like polyferredoxin